jgi:hypothetical protein
MSRRGRLATGNDDADDGLFVWIRKTRTGCWRLSLPKTRCLSSSWPKRNEGWKGRMIFFCASVTERLVLRTDRWKKIDTKANKQDQTDNNQGGRCRSFINCLPTSPVDAGKKGRSTRLRRFEAFPWARPQHAYALAHCLASLAFSSPLIPAYHHRPSLQTGRAQPFCPASPASRSKHRENRDACEDATPQLCPSPTPDSSIVVYHCRYHKVVDVRIPVSHISRSRLTVIDSSTVVPSCTRQQQQIPQRLTVAVISSRDSHPVFSPSRLARFRTAGSYLWSRTRGQGRRTTHACT